MRRLTLLALAVMLCLSAVLPSLVAQPAFAQDDGYTPVFDEADCPRGVNPQHTTCGFLTVPEDRAVPTGTQIRLAVAILHAETETPAPDPVVYLSGGPGSGALGTPRQLFSDLLDTRDVILIDQRGTGFSQPSLACPETMTPDVINATILAVSGDASALREALQACRDRLVGEGVNLAAYTSASNAADVDDLRRALGIEQWNLYGASYGTRLAQTIMRDHPAGVRSAILDAVVPLERDMTAELPTLLFQAIETLLAGCAADEICAYAFPDLETRWLGLVNQLQAEPVRVTITHPVIQARMEVAVDGALLLQVIFAALYNFERQINGLPLLIADLSDGDFSDLSGHLVNALAFGGGSALGMTLSLNCAEETALSALAGEQIAIMPPPGYAPDLTALVGDWAADTVAECAIWDVPAADPIEGQPVVSDIPALLLNGSFDPITPPEYAAQVHANLSHSAFYEFPAEGHGVYFANGCARQVADAFLADLAATPTHGCLDAQAPPVFFIPRDVARELAAQREAEQNAALDSLTPVTLDELGVTLRVPAGWAQDEPGVFAGPEATLIIAQVAGDDLAAAVAAFSAAQDMRAPRRASGEQVTDAFAWTTYSTLDAGEILAIAAAVDGDTTRIVALRGAAANFPQDLFTAVLESVARAG